MKRKTARSSLTTSGSRVEASRTIHLVSCMGLETSITGESKCEEEDTEIRILPVPSLRRCMSTIFEGGLATTVQSGSPLPEAASTAIKA